MKLSGILAEKGLHAFDGEPHAVEGVRIPREWIVVADREQAHIYRKTPHKVERIADAVAGHAKSNHEEAGSRGALSHGYDAHSEKKHHGDSAFLQRLSIWIDAAVAEHVFDRLVLVAPPHALGDIRTLLKKKTQEVIIAEVDKDWIKLPQKEIEENLSKLAWL